MYPLILTHEERKAIDWIGNRYATGDEFKELLRQVISTEPSYSRPSDYTFRGGYENINQDLFQECWEFDQDFIFHIPEHIAWQIGELFEQEHFLFPCFSEEFKFKLLEWYWRIV